LLINPSAEKWTEPAGCFRLLKALDLINADLRHATEKQPQNANDPLDRPIFDAKLPG
jgi:hypothetical protein